jgi:hypothetical protein
VPRLPVPYAYDCQQGLQTCLRPARVVLTSTKVRSNMPLEPHAFIPRNFSCWFERSGWLGWLERLGWLVGSRG